MRQYWLALIAVIALLLGGSAWLYERDGDSFLSLARSAGPTHSALHAPIAKGHATEGSVVFAGSTSATELPCAIRRSDVRKVLAFLAAKGEKSRADLNAVCRHYGVAAVSVPGP